MGFQVGIKTAVSKLNNKVEFLQPVYEAISNSLEAHAHNISVEFSVDNSQINISKEISSSEKIKGFTITDDGEGFTKDNIESFSELWTAHKKSIGCKGVGRLTWLKVYQHIDIYSKLKNYEVTFCFSEDFIPEDIIPQSISDNSENNNITRLAFRDVTENYYKKQKDGSVYDNREKADIDKIYIKIKKHLLVKLALLKENNVNFRIVIKIGKEEKIIDNDDITELKKQDFQIEDYNKNMQDFRLYYNFVNDGLNQKDSFYCANGRIVSEFPDTISLDKIKNQDSIIMLLTSDYLDSKVNDERNGFIIEKQQNNEDIDNCLSFPKINEALRDNMETLLIKQYPNISKENKKELDAAIKEVPYLAAYIQEDKSVIKKKNDVIKRAKEVFEREKQNASSIFVRMLKQKNINPENFEKSIVQLNKIAIEELGEYILYRQQIIEGLKKALLDREKKEDYIHNIIMQMKIAIDDKLNEEDKHYFTNFWLFDDKFMTYSYAASDKTTKQITNDIKQSYERIYKSADRPDIAIFYNKDDNQKDAILMELKGANATKDEKDKSLIELPNNIDTMRKNIPECNRIWGYIITDIDDEFERSIKNQERYQPLFSNAKDGKAYYTYFKEKKTHVTIIDLKSIISDADARNKVFLNILSKQRNAPQA